MALVLSTTTNPGSATWSEASGSASAQKVSFMLADGSVAPTESTSYYTATAGTQIDISVAAPSFAGQMLTVFMSADAGQNTVLTFPLALNSAGNTIVTLNDANDSFGAIAVASGLTALRWVPLFNNGCTLS